MGGGRTLQVAGQYNDIICRNIKSAVYVDYVLAVL